MARVSAKPAAARKPRAKPVVEKRVMPVVTTKVQDDTRKLDMASEGTNTFTDDNERIEEGVIEIQGDIVGLSKKAEALKFLEEKLLIQISDAEDNTKEPMVFCSVNGVGPGPNGETWIPRNQPVSIARKFVAVLLKARGIRYKSVEKTNSNGERYNEYPPHVKQTYPLQVLSDPNPLGAAWLRDMMMRRAG